jgi:hypothetical protein
LQTSINRGPQPKKQKKKKKFLEIQIFFKTNSSSKEVISSSNETLLKALKLPLSTLEVYKE